MKIGIAIPCFNRTESLNRLLVSLKEANYVNDKVDLIFSIDYSGTNNVKFLAENFQWDFGKKIIIVHPANIGLKQNILSCGDLVEKYDAIIILEDDLYVAKDFYNYAKQAALYYLDSNDIAGISLFSYKYTEIGFYQFYPFHDNYDTFFIQWPSSWGQLWTKQQWNSFRKWLSLGKSLEDINVPESIKLWNHSWKKYYIAYMVDMDRYFVYPYVSFTNDFGSSGVHHVNQSNICTTSLFFGDGKKYLFRDFDRNNLCVYDCFFQMRNRNLTFNGKAYDVCFDLYSTKSACNIDTDYVITSKTIKKPIISFGSIHIPFEYNILKNEGGCFFYLTTKNEYKKQHLNILKKETLRMKMFVPDMIKYVCYKVKKKILG